jgi:hypothetical protein
MKTRVLIVALVAALFVVLAGCEFSTPAGSSVDVSGVLVSIPSAINNPNAGRAVFSGQTLTVEDELLADVQPIYNPIREHYNPIAQDVIDFADQLITAVQTHIFDNEGAMTLLDSGEAIQSTDATAGEKWQVTKSGGTYTVENWQEMDDGSWKKILHMTVNTESGYSGTIYACVGDAADGYPMTIKVVYDTADATLGQVTELEAVGMEAMADATETTNIPSKLWLKASQKDGVFNVAANVFYTQVKLHEGEVIGDKLTARIGNGSTTDVNGAYVYRGVVNVDTNKGKVELALTPANQNDAGTIFTTWSMAENYKQAVAEWITGDATLMSDINTIADPDIDTSSSADDVFAALVDVADHFEAQGTQDPELLAILYVTKLTNPGFFDGTATSAFVGTNDLRKPDWAANIPQDFGLDVQVTPQTISGLSLTMPGEAQPSF